MKKYFRINYLGIEISNKPMLFTYHSLMDYSEAIDLDLIKGNKDGWRLPSIKEWKFLSILEPLEIISFPEYYYLTSEAGPEYIPLIIRNTDPVISKRIEEDPSYLEDSGIGDIYIWDSRMNDEWSGEYDGTSLPYILVRDIKI